MTPNPPRPSAASSFSLPSNFYVFLIGFIILFLWLISNAAAIIFMFGMLPSFIAAAVDHDRDRYLTKIVSSFNLMGTLINLGDVVRNMNDSDYGWQVVLEPATWMFIYAAAGVGWIFYWVFPQFSIIFHKIRIENRLIRLNAELNKLTAEWGEEIRNGTFRNKD